MLTDVRTPFLGTPLAPLKASRTLSRRRKAKAPQSPVAPPAAAIAWPARGSRSARRERSPPRKLAVTTPSSRADAQRGNRLRLMLAVVCLVHCTLALLKHPDFCLRVGSGSCSAWDVKYRPIGWTSGPEEGRTANGRRGAQANMSKHKRYIKQHIYIYIYIRI